MMLVPVEPTEEMRRAVLDLILSSGDIHYDEDRGTIVVETYLTRSAWRTFLEHAPAQPDPGELAGKLAAAAELVERGYSETVVDLVPLLRQAGVQIRTAASVRQEDRSGQFEFEQQGAL
jgi:hypothetical protein